MFITGSNQNIVEITNLRVSFAEACLILASFLSTEFSKNFARK